MLRFLYAPSFSIPSTMMPRVRRAQFGDGYEQRSQDGINVLLQKWSLTFENRAKSDADEIEGFLRAHGGVTAFEFVAPGSEWSVTGESFGTGDGARVEFQLQRQILHLDGAEAMPGAFLPCADFSSGPTIYVAGAAKVAETDYTLDDTGLVTFTAAPASGAALTFDGAGDDVLHCICGLDAWKRTATGPDVWTIEATFQEVPE